MLRSILLAMSIAAIGTSSQLYAQGFKQFRTAHIDLLAPDQASISLLSDELEHAYRDVVSYGLRLPSSVQVVCYATTTQFVQRAHAERYYLAIAIGTRMHLQPMSVFFNRRAEYSRALRHELVHVVLAKAARMGLPRWLNEGLAMVVAGESRSMTTHFTTTDELDKALVSRKPGVSSAGYAAARRLTDALILLVGKSTLLDLVTMSRAMMRQEFTRQTSKEFDGWCTDELRLR